MLIRSTTTREPEWTELDRAEALALVEHRVSLCPCGCGYPYVESTSHWEEGPEFDATKTSCRARAAQIEAQSAAVEAGKGVPGTWIWSISKTEKG